MLQPMPNSDKHQIPAQPGGPEEVQQGLAELYPNFTAQIERITPALAKEWLERSMLGNRDWKAKTIAGLRQEFLRGKMGVNGESIIFDDEGNILDGSHRLRVCVETGITFDYLVVRGVDPRRRPMIDTGSMRDIADDLTMEMPSQRKIHRVIQSMFPLVLQYCGHSSGVGANAYWRTVPGRREILDVHPAIREAAAKVDLQTKSIVPPGVVGSLYYFGGFAHAAETTEFVAQLINGLNCNAGDPAYTVREYLNATNRKLVKLHSKMRAWEIFISCAYGLRQFIEGEKMERLRLPAQVAIPGAAPAAIAIHLGLEAEIDSTEGA